MAWFYNPISPRFLKIGLVTFLSPPLQSAGKVCTKIRALPKEFANFKTRASAAHRKKQFFNVFQISPISPFF
jgi:hypothetical protein